MTRRQALASALHASLPGLRALAAVTGAALQGPGCARPARLSPAEDPEAKLAIAPLTRLVPGAELTAVLEVAPRRLLTIQGLAEATVSLWPASAERHLAKRYGVDLGNAEEVVLAMYPDVLLALVRGQVDPPRVEAAFSARADLVEGRAVELGVTRLWGTVDSAREQIAVLGHQGAALERGRFGPLRAAEYFAQGRLKRVMPAIASTPLSRLAPMLEGPVRLLAPGPFEGEWASGLSGLLGTATCAGASLGGKEDGGKEDDGKEDGAVLRVAIAGRWRERAVVAADRLREAFGALSRDPLALLLGFDRPLTPPKTRVIRGYEAGPARDAGDGAPGDVHAEIADRTAGQDDLIALEVMIDPVLLAKGVRAATSARVAEILSF